jgi:hypothetical protein
LAQNAANVRFPPLLSIDTNGPDPTFVDGAAKVGYDPKMQRFCNAANVGFSSSTDVLL